LWRQQLPIALTGLGLMIVAIVMINWLSPDEEGAGGRNFSGNRDDLVVLNTSVKSPAKKPEFWLTGVITNRGKYPWRVNELEVRFMDQRGNLLDVRHPEVKDKFVVQPYQGHGFRVELGELAFTNQNVARQVRVQMATDGDRPLKSD
jgi:hypothetical protein